MYLISLAWQRTLQGGKYHSFVMLAVNTSLLPGENVIFSDEVLRRLWWLRPTPYYTSHQNALGSFRRGKNCHLVAAAGVWLTRTWAWLWGQEKYLHTSQSTTCLRPSSHQGWEDKVVPAFGVRACPTVSEGGNLDFFSALSLLHSLLQHNSPRVISILLTTLETMTQYVDLFTVVANRLAMHVENKIMPQIAPTPSSGGACQEIMGGAKWMCGKRNGR
jgi:hypothetical protein